MAKKKPASPARPRTARRALEQKARKLVHHLEQLAAEAPGGSEERPLEVTSAAVIELRAKATPCPQCGGELDVLEHEAVRGLRPVRVKCRLCHTPRTIWFRLISPEAN
jgi:uncharacterized protein with PIN domain